MAKKVLPLLISLFWLSFYGCVQQKRVEPLGQTCIQGVEKKAVMEAIEDLIFERGFSTEKYDEDMGVVISEPLRGGQWFEFWQKDNVGSFNRAESNLHSIRRLVRFDVSSADNRTCVECRVLQQRLNLPEKETRGSSEISGIFTQSGTSMQELEIGEERAEEMEWVELGRDVRLENEFLKTIKEKLQRSVK